MRLVLRCYDLGDAHLRWVLCLSVTISVMLTRDGSYTWDLCVAVAGALNRCSPGVALALVMTDEQLMQVASFFFKKLLWFGPRGSILRLDPTGKGSTLTVNRLFIRPFHGSRRLFTVRV